MLERNMSVVAQMRLRRNVGLPRRGICIRSVHHVFNPEGETEEADDRDGISHVRQTCSEFQSL